MMKYITGLLNGLLRGVGLRSTKSFLTVLSMIVDVCGMRFKEGGGLTEIE